MVADALGISKMSQRAPEHPSEARPEDRAVFLFAQLDIAQARGEYARAAEAQRKLESLGWIVSRRRPSRHRATCHPAATAEAVTR